MGSRVAKTPFQKALAKALIPPDAELLTVDDCARITRRHIMRIYDDIRAGRLQAVRFGQDGSKRPSIRVRRSALEAFIAAGEVRAGCIGKRKIVFREDLEAFKARLRGVETEGGGV